MTLTRRRFLSIAAASTAAPLALTSLASAKRRSLVPFTYFEWRGIPRGPQRPMGATGYSSGMMVAVGEGGNALAMARNSELLLIDCKNAPFGELLKRESLIAPFDSGRAELALVINTHHHADHTGGNWAFTADHTVLAHAKASERVAGQLDRYTAGAAEAPDQANGDDPKSKVVRPYLEKFADRAPQLTAADFQPNEALKSDHETREVGGVTIQLHHFGPGHTDTDVAVYFPEENVLHTGDLLFHGLHPFCDAPGGCSTRGWQRSLSELINMCNDDTIVIPGHGDITNTAALRAQRDYFDRVREIVADAAARGLTRDEVTQLPPTGFESLGFQQIWPRVLGVAFDEAAAG
ncbi:MAG: MBL fold metallo-hydrolase [Phycisphaerales bacterium]|nr:MBL fold metallo-hydrolase [Phycisphaerales bacterium]